MKNKLQILSAISLVALSTSAFSGPVKSPADCPSANTVAAHSNFTQAIQLDPLWVMVDMDPYEVQGANWLTGFVAQLDATTDVEALEEGKKVFPTIQLNAPEVMEGSCIYAMSESPFYVVGAFQMDGMDGNYKTKLARFARR